MAYKKEKKQTKHHPQIPKQDLIDYINCKDAVKSIQFAEVFGKYLQSESFTINKLRTFFGEVDAISANENNISRKRVALLKPKLAYLVGRENRWSRDIVDYFKEVMEVMIDELLKKDVGDEFKNAFIHFVDFIKATVAYHKYNGGN